jgi:hypothetical protein
MMFYVCKNIIIAAYITILNGDAAMVLEFFKMQDVTFYKVLSKESYIRI